MKFLAIKNVMRFEARQNFLLYVDCLQTIFAFILRIQTKVHKVLGDPFRYTLMGFLESLNRILVGMLLLLVLLQAGLLFFMRSMEDQAQYKLVQNKTTAPISCDSDPFDSNNYWDILDGSVQSAAECESAECASSFVAWKRENQKKEVHVISVNSAPAFRWGEMDQGGQIKVRVKRSDKPQIITLISRKRLEWNFHVEAGAKIDKVVVATPELVWLQGLPPETVIEYLPKDKMCSYTFTWQEAFNADNQFRVLIKSLQAVTGEAVTSFQGANVGKEFRVPLVPVVRGPASIGVRPVVKGRSVASWSRKQGHVVAAHVELDGAKIPLPEKTVQVLKGPEKSVYIVENYHLKRWNKVTEQFEVLKSPMYLPEVGDVTGMALDERDNALFVYNDQRGGELYKFFPSMDKWVMLSRGYNYNFQGFYFDNAKNVLVGVASQGAYLSHLVYMDDKGQKLKVDDLKNKIAFDKTHWRWELGKNQETPSLLIHTAASPDGYGQDLE